MSFALSPDEVRARGLSAVFQRVIDEQLGLAIRALAEQDADPVEAVHEARKALKRVRTILRLCVRFLGKPAVREHSAAVRAVAAKLAPIRDAQMLDDALRKLAESCKTPTIETKEKHRDKGEAEGASSRVRTAAGTPYVEVVSRVRATYAETPSRQLSDDELGTVIAELNALRERLATLLKDGEAVGSFGRSRKSALRKLEAAVRRLLRRGTAAFDEVILDREPGTNAKPSPPARASLASIEEHFHTLRKRVKDYYYAACLFTPSRPRRIAELAAKLDELADVLGDEHDLGILADRAHDDPTRFGGVVPVALLLQLIARRKEELRAQARRECNAVFFGPARHARHSHNDSKLAQARRLAKLKVQARWLTHKLFAKPAAKRAA